MRPDGHFLVDILPEDVLFASCGGQQILHPGYASIDPFLDDVECTYVSYRLSRVCGQNCGGAVRFANSPRPISCGRGGHGTLAPLLAVIADWKALLESALRYTFGACPLSVNILSSSPSSHGFCSAPIPSSPSYRLCATEREAKTEQATGSRGGTERMHFPCEPCKRFASSSFYSAYYRRSQGFNPSL